jgi:hypothetical protein
VVTYLMLFFHLVVNEYLLCGSLISRLKMPPCKKQLVSARVKGEGANAR